MRTAAKNRKATGPVQRAAGGKVGAKEAQPARGRAAFSNFSNDEPLLVDEVCDSLSALTGGWPKCIAGSLCFPRDGRLHPLRNPAALFAWAGGHAPVDWRRGPRAVTKEELFERLSQRKAWDWATAEPHFPPVDGVLYLEGLPPAKKNGMLDELLDHFLPMTGKDRELIRALVLTLFWGGPAGARPQFVVAADEGSDAEGGRGTGKTALAQHLSSLVGGCVDVDPHGNPERVLTNLLSPSALCKRVALVDNLKTLKYSSESLERLITREEITGHRMYTGFATRPNYLTWVVTVNGAHFSTDMARRSVVIRLKRPAGKAVDWDRKVSAFVREYREEIVADVRWHLEVKKRAKLKRVDTWGPWCLGVLSRCADPDGLLDHLQAQRGKIDADKDGVSLALEHIRGCAVTHFREEGRKVELKSSVVWAPTAWLVKALQEQPMRLGAREAHQCLTRLAAVGHLKKANRNDQRGYRLMGANVDPDEPPSALKIEYRPTARSGRRR